MHCTAGCHPTSSAEIDRFPGGADAYFAELEGLITADRAAGKRIVSIGEVGLGKQLTS
jgi:TatD DNase family protein